MRVGINVGILWSPLTGIGQYTLSLIQALSRVGQEIDWVWLGATSTGDGIPVGRNIQAISSRPLLGPYRTAWQQFGLPRIARRAGVELLHCPDPTRPFFSSVPIVNTVHDLSCYTPQPFFSPANLAYKRFMARTAMVRSAAIITVSQFARSEILNRFPQAEGRVFVIHNGVNRMPDGEKTRASPPFILFVGTLEERKNVARLVQAFDWVRSRGQVSHRLVLVGEQGWGRQKIQEAIQTSPFRQDIEMRGYVSREELVQLYRSADLFVYPSVYEGFGLPVVEAMACGTPVICSRAASLPEVAGDAAELFDPNSVEDLACTMERVLESSDLRAAMRLKGLQRAKQLTWDECARKHCEVYQQVAQQ